MDGSVNKDEEILESDPNSDENNYAQATRDDQDMEASMELVVEADSIGPRSPAGKVVQTEVKNLFASPASAATSTSRKTSNPKNVKSAISAYNFFLK